MSIYGRSQVTVVEFSTVVLFSETDLCEDNCISLKMKATQVAGTAEFKC
jgi:hypothetical protein